jgi:hypothetical protein
MTIWRRLFIPGTCTCARMAWMNRCAASAPPVVECALRLLAISSEWVASLEYHRPLPEPNDMTTRPPYRVLPRYFELVSAVVIIGYSFGAQASGKAVLPMEKIPWL